MEADFEELKPVCIAVAKALEDANEIRVTSHIQYRFNL